jgi:lysophospholipase L1-like esterase
VDISSIKLRQRQVKGITLLGDSKVVGYGAGAIENTMANKAKLSVYACGGDQTSSIIASLPYFNSYVKSKTVILCIGCNDKRFGVADATAQANYAAIVTALTAAGVSVYHLLPIPESSLDQSALRAYIVANYNNANCIDVTGSFATGSMLNGDGVHPNAAGHKMISNYLHNFGM